jgi:hypothetical protein
VAFETGDRLQGKETIDAAQHNPRTRPKQHRQRGDGGDHPGLQGSRFTLVLGSGENLKRLNLQGTLTERNLNSVSPDS